MPALWPIVLVAAHTAMGEVPKFNIGPTCRAASANSEMHRPQGACERDEKNARSTLQKKWGSYTVQDRARCTTMVQTGGPPSYVELLTCLQTAAEAAKLPKGKM
ncbi:MAG: hypothetical protein P8Z80_05940 [Pseudolabrys sp.]|jgi:hypothetical protein